MANNLASSQISSWKNQVDKTIRTDLVGVLKKMHDNALNLKAVTATTKDDGNNLSYRFNDLAKVTNQAAQQLETFMKSFDSDLTAYINKTKSSEAKVADAAKKSIDQFAEAAAKIAKLKM